jgi:phage recombination protein Bet
MEQIIKADGGDITPEKIELIKRTVAKNATDDELQMFIHQCNRTGLDPLTRQIYFMKISDRVSIITSIDGFRIIAQRSTEYEGQTAPIWYDATGAAYEVWVAKEKPSACKVGVYRRNFREPLYAIARFDEYAKAGGMWDKMPALMIAKVAEALALRKAFPNDMSGLYTTDEMEQAQPARTYSHVKDFTNFATDEELEKLETLVGFGEASGYLNSEQIKHYIDRIKLTRERVARRVVGNKTPIYAIEHGQNSDYVYSELKQFIEEQAQERNDVDQTADEQQEITAEVIDVQSQFDQLNDLMLHDKYATIPATWRKKLEALFDKVSSGEEVAQDKIDAAIKIITETYYK